MRALGQKVSLYGHRTYVLGKAFDGQFRRFRGCAWMRMLDVFYDGSGLSFQDSLEPHLEGHP